MTELYTVTAANRFFYMNLAVRAKSREGAFEKFLQCVTDAKSHEAEAYELEQAQQLGVYSEGAIELDPASYRYSVDFNNVALIEDGVIPGYLGEVGDEVVMTKSGGNG